MPLDPADILKNLPEAARELIRQKAVAECWRRGELSYKFHATQHKIYASLKKATRRKFFLLCSRRLGKTFMLMCLAFEAALKKPGCRVLFLAPYAKDAADIATDTTNAILADFPAGMQKPEVKAHLKEIHFANGSIIRLKGVNAESADSLRGGTNDLVILDEVGQMDRLTYVLNDVAMPTTMTTGGKILLATTPAPSPAHDSTKIYFDLFDTGDAVKFTILDAPHVDDTTKAEYLREVGEKPEHLPLILAGKMMPKGTTALREYFTEFVTDANRAVVKEMREHEQHIIRVHPRPKGPFDAYVAIDPGFEDKTGIVFGIFDFAAGIIAIEDEAILHRASTNDIAKVILEKEWELWRDEKPYLRVVDNNPRLAADLFERHGLSFAQAQKQDALGGINLLRTMVGNHEIAIDPRCTRLIDQMRNATWNNKATDFARTGDVSDDSLGHWDLLSALRYLTRSVNRHRNPYPPGFRQPIGLGGDGLWRSPRRRFKGPTPGAQQIDLLGDTPAARRLKRRT